LPIVDNTFIRFVLVGITNTAVGLSVTWVAWHVAGLGDWWSNALGYIVGFIWSFTLNRLWSFKAQQATASGSTSGVRQFARFALVCAVSYGVNSVALYIGRAAMGPTSFIPFITAMVAYSIVNYLGSRYYVFARR
jgi:putative flippase GtrA